MDIDDNELAELRNQRMMQLQQQQIVEQEQAQRRKQLQAQIQSVLMQIMDPAARERLNTIKIAKPEFAQAIEQQLVALAQSGRIHQKITDDQLKQIIMQVMPKKKEFNIRRVG